MRILIAGCGDLGTKAGLELCRQGHEVFGLKRNSQTITAPIKAIAADLSQPLDSNLLPASIDQVIYILAASGFNEQAYQSAYVDGVKHLIRALGSDMQRLKRFIFVSSSSVYAQNEGQWVDETSVTQPQSFNGQIMLAAEQQVLNLANALIVRFSGIYGPGRSRMIDQVKSGHLAAPEPVIYSNRIHSSDCTGVLAHLSQLDCIDHRLVLASDHQPTSLFELHQWIADQLGVKKENRLYQQTRRRAGSKRISNKRLLEMGYKFNFPDYTCGYSQMLDAIRNP